MRKLWNRTDLAVWSVSTVDEDGIGNMNIATYVSAVSLKPKLMMVAVYKDTQTLKNLRENNRCLLQLLSKDLAPAVRVCGKLSGSKIDKIARLKKRYKISEHSGLSYFEEAAGYLELKIVSWQDVGGDHLLVTGKVLSHVNLSDAEILTTDHLRELNIIR